MKALPSITSWVIAAAVWAATLLLLLAHQSQLQAEVRAVHAEGTELRRRLLLLERPFFFFFLSFFFGFSPPFSHFCFLFCFSSDFSSPSACALLPAFFELGFG